jgi:hypothetical protein
MKNQTYEQLRLDTEKRAAAAYQRIRDMPVQERLIDPLKVAQEHRTTVTRILLFLAASAALTAALW